jgi:sensor histidine kinase YesM
LVLLITSIGFFAWLISRRLERGLSDVWLPTLEERIHEIDQILNKRDSYFVVDQAYLAKLAELFAYGPEPLAQVYASEEDYINLSFAANNILMNLRRGMQFSGSLRSLYLLLDDDSAPYLIVSGRVTPIRDLADISWLQTCAAMGGDRFYEWRTLSLSYTRTIEVFSTYERIISTHWRTGQQYYGYLVMNYDRSAIVNQISARLNATEAAYLYNANSAEGLYIGADPSREALAADLMQAYLGGSAQASGNLSGQMWQPAGGRSYYRIEQMGDRFACLVLKQDTDLSSVLSNGYLFFVGLLLICSVVILGFGFINLRQYRRYGASLRAILTLAEGAGGDPLPDVAGHSRTDYNQIVDRLLRNTIDLDELETLLQSEKDLRTELEILYGHVQINSHFLLNTMDSIYWSSVQSSGADSDESVMIENLCLILKYALDSSELDASLREEVNSARMYLEIQAIRKNTAFDVVWDIPDTLWQTRMGKLTLQPILENCIQHGMLSATASLSIQVCARAQGDTLLLTITDNGRGVAPAEMHRLNRKFRSGSRVKTRHIGLSNVNRRIQVQYGHEYGLILSPAEPAGLCVTMRLALTPHIGSQSADDVKSDS